MHIINQAGPEHRDEVERIKILRVVFSCPCWNSIDAVFLITQEISCFLDSQGPSFQQWAHAIDLCNDPPIVYMRVAAEKGLGY